MATREFHVGIGQTYPDFDTAFLAVVSAYGGAWPLDEVHIILHGIIPPLPGAYPMIGITPTLGFPLVIRGYTGVSDVFDYLILEQYTPNVTFRDVTMISPLGGFVRHRTPATGAGTALKFIRLNVPEGNGFQVSSECPNIEGSILFDSCKNTSKIMFTFGNSTLSAGGSIIFRNNVSVETIYGTNYLFGAYAGTPMIAGGVLVLDGNLSNHCLMQCPALSKTGGDIYFRNNIVTQWAGYYPVMQVDPTLFTEIDYNHYYVQSATDGWGTGYHTLAAWQAATGQESHSQEGDPLLDANYRLTANSPCRNKGKNLSADAVNPFNYDRDGQPRKV
jgi:hypothetical protein